jgi:glucokinase
MVATPYVLAFELGAATIGAAVFDFNQRCVGDVQTAPTMARQLMIVTLMNLKRAGEQARRIAGFEGPPLAVGMGGAGRVDLRRGCLSSLEPLPALQHFAIDRFVRDEFGARLYLENNANCFTLAEALVGAGRGHPVVLGLALGAGFGFGIVINGRIYRGVSGNAGELSYCSQDGEPLTNLLSAAGAGVFYRRITGRAAPRPEELAGLARAGDAAALETWHEYGLAVGRVLGFVAAVVDPSICVIGGNVGRLLNSFRQPLEHSLRESLPPQMADRICVAPTQLDHLAAVTGAAKYAFQKIEQK